MNYKSAVIVTLISIFFLIIISCQSDPNNVSSTRSVPNKSSTTGAVTSAGSTARTSTLSAGQASKHLGERGTVCGRIVDTNYSKSSNGQPTFLNYDKPYPHHPFVVVIWGDDRRNFPKNPEKHYLKKQVCATGLIESYKGKPQIIARASNQIYIQ